MHEEQKTAQSLYQELSTLRDPFLRAARQAAALTIPSLLPPDGHSNGAELPTPWSSIGADGVNSLASSLLLSLMPVNAPFFKLTVDDYALQEVMAESGLEGAELTRASAEIEASFDRVVDTVMVEIETTGVRTKVFEGIKHLLVAGNVLLHVQPRGGIKVFLLDQFVVDRDPAGAVLTIIVKESVSPAMLPEELRGSVEEAQGDHRRKDVDIYTAVELIRGGDFDAGIRGEPGDYRVYQEVMGKRVPGSEGTYKSDTLPWLPLRLTEIANEDYGRGRVEEYIGSLKSAEALSEAIVSVAAAGARLVGLVNPNGMTAPKDLNDCRNGQFIPGQADDVTFLQVEKYADMRVAKDALDDLKSDLKTAFLNHASIQRSGERVTATEIRYLAAQLEQTLGGTYSLLALEMQLPLVRILMDQMGQRGDLPDLPEQIQPSLVAGLDAIGKGQDAERLDSLMEFMAQLGPEGFSMVHVAELLGRAANARGIKSSGLIKTAEELAQERAQAQQAAQQQALIEQGTGPAINQIGAAAAAQQQAQAG